MIGFHLVFCPKFRRPLFADPRIKAETKAIFEGECLKHGWDIVAFEIMPDHVHLFVEVPRTVTPALIAQTLKGISSHELRKHMHHLKGIERKAFWATGYWAESVGSANRETIKHYIENQTKQAAPAIMIKVTT